MYPDEQGELALDQDKLEAFANRHRDDEVLVYGFTFILWNHLAKPFLEKNICLNLRKVRVLHSGGWKRLQDQAVDKATFNDRLARIFGCSAERIVDFYGMVESVGVIFPDCSEGNKHAPAFGDVIVRDPLTLEPVAAGGHGIVQVCSILPVNRRPKLTPYRRPKLTPLVRGSDGSARPGGAGRGCAAGASAVR